MKKINLSEIKLNKKSIILLLILVLCLILIIILSSNAFLSSHIGTPAIENINVTTCLDITFEDQNPINLTNTYPMSDNKGKLTTPYTFTVTNTCSNSTPVYVYLAVFTDSTMSESNVKYYLDTSNDTQLLSAITPTTLSTNISSQLTTNVNKTIKNIYLLDTRTLNSNVSQIFNLRMWVDLNAGNSTQNKVFYPTILVTDE